MQKLLFVFILFFCVHSGFAQSADKAKMESERKEIQQEIRDLQNSLSKVKGQTKANLAKLRMLERKLELQDRLIANINKEINIISGDIYTSNLEINRLQKQLDTLKIEYAKSVVYAYKNKSSYDYLNFIFSASSFNDALKRVSYLKAYRSYRQQQVANIEETQKLIQDRKQQLLGKQSQKKSALENQRHEMASLEVQKKEKDAVVSKLKSQEKDLAQQMAIKRKRDKILRGQIAAIVRREIEKAKKEEEARLAAIRKKEADASKSNASSGTVSAPVKKSAPAKKQDYLVLNEGQAKLAANFASNRGSLPWPVDNGNVSIPFGTSRVEGLSMDNPGITISTPNAGATVKAVFDGEVSAVSNTGDGMMVMIRHGKYFTVYSNLSSASVSRGDNVRTGQAIGRTAQADDGSGGQLDFMLMIESQNVNPQPWLRR
ncbi:murein hydrolase activator EnvC family protein [Flavisolibacter ginsengisoli]|jgi:septal ring factor EnvC (AmiA/AmiB activator)|uniref:Septal ring factor EnvC, activator of murein hydrolases AmiA and AmiB n=1 Tax=Flavisolibacter ginsengisoli DSM 18119 TaxID=1121884 RepID=A0A1M5AXG5_9BACT|nr:peptidoglycan DD-metalloendopeptidase family protein [Flavisolibacter ginsengisoli]SHF34938.1 Septal ring factor EnvC, activator of murein hydrolases AmiA and AmiB [Flavisolibacter ginsengisoli DSM 18119]